MQPSTARKACFVAAAPERFVPEFDGGLAVVHGGPPEAHRRRLAQACSGVRFEPVSPEWRARLAALGAARSDFARRRGRLCSLEAFRLRYDACPGCPADAHVRSAGDRRRRNRG